MDISHSAWHKASFPFLWYRVVAYYGSTLFLFDAHIQYRFFWASPCEHEWDEREIHGDERLERGAVLRRQCKHCGKVELD